MQGAETDSQFPPYRLCYILMQTFCLGLHFRRITEGRQNSLCHIEKDKADYEINDHFNILK